MPWFQARPLTTINCNLQRAHQDLCCATYYKLGLLRHVHASGDESWLWPAFVGNSASSCKSMCLRDEGGVKSLELHLLSMMTLQEVTKAKCRGRPLGQSFRKQAYRSAGQWNKLEIITQNQHRYIHWPYTVHSQCMDLNEDKLFEVKPASLAG